MLAGSLKILYVGTLPPHPGGGAISCGELLLGLARRGHSVHALAPLVPTLGEGSDRFAAEHPEITVTRFLVSHFHADPNVLASEEYRRREREQIREAVPILIARSRPDLVFIGRGIFALDVPDCAESYSLPCVLRTAGATAIGMFNGTFPNTFAEQLIAQYRRMQLIISPAAHLAVRLRDFGFTNVQTIRNAIDLQRFRSRPKSAALMRHLGIGSDDVIIVHASNLKTLKRPLDVVDSAARALPHCRKLMYVVVADGPLRGALEDACQRKRLSERFRFVGWVDYRCMPDYINLADIVVMPSDDEALARVYLETQACGRVLLASDIPGAREVLVDGESGLLFHKGDVDDLAVMTLRAARDPELRARIGRQARRRVRAHSLDDALTAYTVAFHRVVEAHRAAPRRTQVARA